MKDILCAIFRRQSNTIKPAFRGIEWLLQKCGSRRARSRNLLCRFQMGLQVWFRVILSLRFSILFQVSVSTFETGVSQSRKVPNLLFYTPPFDWQIRSLLIVPKRPIVYLLKVNIHLKLLINLFD